jgi:hypothetical protein
MKSHPPGDIQAFDIKTGKRLALPAAAAEGRDGQRDLENDSWKTTGSGNMWARPAATKNWVWCTCRLHTHQRLLWRASQG